MRFLFVVFLGLLSIGGHLAFTATTTTCAPGTKKDEKTGDCISVITKKPLVDSPGKACVFGIDKCPINEHCVVNNRSRMGACRCVDGYGRNATSGVCERRIEAATTSDVVRKEALDSAPTPRWTVRIMGPKTIALPIKGDVNLTAVVDRKKEDVIEDTNVKYFWSVKSSPLSGDASQSPAVLEGRENETVHLSDLHTGEYTFEVRVTVLNKTSEAEWTLTVLPEKKENQPPVAVIQPPVEHVKENMQIILDGSGSKDADGKIVEYVWTHLDGPVIPDATEGVLARSPTLTLASLPAGNYTFKLTVTDNDGLQNSTVSRVFVTAEVDYPPKAVAGSCDGTLGDVAIRLPIEALFLCGNMSTDDKEITKWKWTLKDTSKNTADMEGTGSAMLKVWNLHVGDYTFNLVVEDVKGQTSSADVHVVVMPAINKPPVAKAGQNQTIRYPESSAILDGSLSSDDKQIASYLWFQIEGPSDAVLTNYDKVRMTVTGLQAGVYAFGLNVTDDDGLIDMDVVYVTVDASDNRAPVPVAADVLVSLPCNMATLDASASTDDAGVVGWLWTQHDNSPAGLELLGSTWQQPLLHVSNLARGIYVFNLTVFDKQGATGSKLVTLNVKRGEKENETVEVYLKTRFSDFTVRLQRKFTKQLKALLETNPKWDRVDVNITKVTEDPSDGSVRILFYASASSYGSESAATLLRASVVADYLEQHEAHSEFMTDFAIRRIDTLYCQNNCSGRGRCEEYTKRCICDRYWMPNLFALYTRGVAKDCDWSVLYFALVLVVVVVSVMGVICLIVRSGGLRCRPCVVGAKTRAVARRVRRYRMLKNQESPKGKNISLKALRGRNGHTPLMSDSDLSSEEETVYDRSSLLSKHRAEENRYDEKATLNGVAA